MRTQRTVTEAEWLAGNDPEVMPDFPGRKAGGRNLKNAKNDAWDEKFNRALQEIAWETVTNYSFSGFTAKEK
jgi:hypothetical protein